MKLTVNTFQSICYELDDKDVPDEVKKNDYVFYNWSDEIICDKAWYDGQWTDDNDLWEFVEEAKIRNLDCKKLGF